MTRILVAHWLGLFAATALAQPGPPATSIDSSRSGVLARRAAEADAYRKLAEALRGLRIDSNTTLGTAAVASDEIRAILDGSLRHASLKEIRFVDGVCEVEATLELDVLSKRLKSNSAGLIDPPGDRRQIRVIGRSASRGDLPPTLPADIVERLNATAQSTPDNEAAELPPVWASIAPAERLLALEAARKDAQRRLAERVAGLRVVAETGVADFAAIADAIRIEATAVVTGAEEIGRPYYAADAAIVQVRMRLPASSVVEAIGTSAAREKFRATVKRDVEAVGIGVPREAALREIRGRGRADEQAGVFTSWPAWAEGELVAEGRGSDTDLAGPQGKLRAARRADHAARTSLAELIAALPLDRGTVGEATLDNERGLRIDALIGEAPATAQFDADGAAVRVRIPAMQIWDILRDGEARP